MALIGNRYEMKKRLGSGGMATVYLAHDTRLDRDVAVKVLRQEADSYDPTRNITQQTESVQRFTREAQMVARLHHPHIVTVHDFGQDENAFYIVMELLTGGSLADRLEKSGRIAPSEAAPILTDVAAALDYAHTQGTLHRDVKPANILFDGDRAKLSDFGIAKAADNSTLTATGAFFGTAGYLSPERIRGEVVGPANDQYALGIVLYEMLTGVRPYRSTDPLVLASMHAFKPIPDPRQDNPALTPASVAVLQRVMAKDPADRYPTCSAFAASFAEACGATSGRSSAQLLHTVNVGNPIRSVAWSPDGRLLSASASDSVFLWNNDGSFRTALKHKQFVSSVAWSPDSQTLAAGSGDKAVWLWNSDGLWRAMLSGHSEWVRSIAWSPDGNTLASSAGRSVILWNANSTIRSMFNHTHVVGSVAWSPDGNTLTTGVNDATVRLWNGDGSLRATLTGHANPVGSVVWSPDGKFLASGSADGTIKLWNAYGVLQRTLTGHTNYVECVAWSPASDILASGSWDHTVRVWNTDGVLRATLAGHTGNVNSVVWSPDGKTLTSGSEDGTIKLWAVGS